MAIWSVSRVCSPRASIRIQPGYDYRRRCRVEALDNAIEATHFKPAYDLGHGPTQMQIQSGLVWILLLLAACTKAPGTITQAQLSQTTYADWTCVQLATEQTRLSIASTLDPIGEASPTSKTEKDSAAEAIRLAMDNQACTKATRPIVASVAQEPAPKPRNVTR